LIELKDQNCFVHAFDIFPDSLFESVNEIWVDHQTANPHLFDGVSLYPPHDGNDCDVFTDEETVTHA
jgi:hypothetical protein